MAWKYSFTLVLLFTLIKSSAQVTSEKDAVATTLDHWHKAAAEAKFDPYFALMTRDAVFIGTDATENWQLDTFIAFAKPIFEKGRAWDFKAVDRNIYFTSDGNTAWFDELLDTWMGLCRGSGVLLKQDGNWKIAHYVLSIAIPNDNTVEVLKLKKEFDDAYLKKIQQK